MKVVEQHQHSQAAAAQQAADGRQQQAPRWLSLMPSMGGGRSVNGSLLSSLMLMASPVWCC